MPAGNGGQASEPTGTPASSVPTVAATVANSGIGSGQTVEPKWTNADEWVVSSAEPVALHELAERPPEEMSSRSARCLTGKNTLPSDYRWETGRCSWPSMLRQGLSAGWNFSMASTSRRTSLPTGAGSCPRTAR